MALTKLDPVTALVVIDLQKGIVSMPTAHPIAGILQQARALADAFRKLDLPVVLVNVTGVPAGRTEQSRFRGALPDGFADFAPELGQQTTDRVITKQTAGAFTRTDLESGLKFQGVTQVVIIGVATSMGVESTARQAYELGFNVALAIDAMTDMDAALHANSAAKIFPRLGETGTTAEILELLETRGT